MTQHWTDGIAEIEQQDGLVRVSILGDVWSTDYADTRLAATAFDAEVAAEQERSATCAAACREVCDDDSY